MSVLLDLRFAFSSVQGRRPYNEDRAQAIHPLLSNSSPASSSLTSSSSSPSSSSSSSGGDRSCSFFAVFDGHGGEECADYCSRHLHTHISSAADFLLVGSRQRALASGFVSLDEQLLSRAESDREAESGTTCSCVMIDHHFLYSGNCGDTRNVLCRNGEAIVLSVDHKPTDEFERLRVETAGAKVTVQQPPPPKTPHATLRKALSVQAYVELGEGGLAVSRALGDRAFKGNKILPLDRQAIVCTPHVSATERSANDEFLILASDGLWNFVDETKVVEFVRTRLHSDDASERDLDDIVNKLTQFALDKKSNDNVTVLLVVLPQPSKLMSNADTKNHTADS